MMAYEAHIEGAPTEEVVRRLIDEAYVEAKRIITDMHTEFVAIAEGLLEYETLTGDEIRGLMNGQTPFRETEADAAPKSTGVPSAGKAPPRKRPDAEPDAAPEPQPGS